MKYKHVATLPFDTKTSLGTVAQQVADPFRTFEKTGRAELDLSGIGLPFLPPQNVWKQFKNHPVTNLNISANEIEILEPGLMQGLPHLRTFNARKNKIREIPVDFFKSLTEPLRISFNYNPLTNALLGAKSLPEGSELSLFKCSLSFSEREGFFDPKKSGSFFLDKKIQIVIGAQQEVLKPGQHRRQFELDIAMYRHNISVAAETKTGFRDLGFWDIQRKELGILIKKIEDQAKFLPVSERELWLNFGKTVGILQTIVDNVETGIVARLAMVSQYQEEADMPEMMLPESMTSEAKHKPKIKSGTVAKCAKAAGQAGGGKGTLTEEREPDPRTTVAKALREIQFSTTMPKGIKEGSPLFALYTRYGRSTAR